MFKCDECGGNGRHLPHCGLLPRPAPTTDDARPFTGPEKVRYAIALDGGYAWCTEHRTFRWWGTVPCAAKHPPELPRGSFFCAEHDRWHDPSEQAVYCDLPPDPPRRRWWRRR
jgi:hypothetical protein